MPEDGLPAIEIRDRALNGEEIAREVRQAAAARRAASAGLLDESALGSGPLQPGLTGGPDAAPPGLPGLRESLAELIGRGHLLEPEFRSEAPVVGPLIVAVRRLWNWMSTKWYVRPIIGQQSEVNARTARLLGNLVHGQELEARRVRELERKVAALETRLASLEAEDRR